MKTWKLQIALKNINNNHLKYLVQHNERHEMNVLLNSVIFHLK